MLPVLCWYYMSAPRTPARYWLGRKRSPETIEKIRKAGKGRIPWNKGKRRIYSLEARQRMSEAHKRIPPEKHANWKGGVSRPSCMECGTTITYSRKRCIRCAGAMRRGSKAYQWRGGITPLMMSIRNCKQTREWRLAIFARDNFTCKLCGKRGGTMHADHYPRSFAEIFYANKIQSLDEAVACVEFWDIDNGRTLCIPCHRKAPTYNRRTVLRAVSPQPFP